MEKFVSASNERQSFGGLLQSEWFLLQLHSSWVVHLAEQFLFIVLEFQEHYKEKCRSHNMTPGEQFVFIVLEFQQYYNPTTQPNNNSVDTNRAYSNRTGTCRGTHTY